MTQEQELEMLRAENARLKAQANRPLSLKVSEKGAVSLYGMGKFPVTLYATQWQRVIDHIDQIKDFIVDNHTLLSYKS